MSKDLLKDNFIDEDLLTELNILSEDIAELKKDYEKRFKEKEKGLMLLIEKISKIEEEKHEKFEEFNKYLKSIQDDVTQIQITKNNVENADNVINDVLEKTKRLESIADYITSAEKNISEFLQRQKVYEKELQSFKNTIENLSNSVDTFERKMIDLNLSIQTTELKIKRQEETIININTLISNTLNKSMEKLNALNQTVNEIENKAKNLNI